MLIFQKSFEEYQIMEPTQPVSVAPASKTFDQAIASLDKYQKVLEERGHTSVRIEKVVKRKIKNGSWSDGKKVGYETISSEPIAICRLEENRFVCERMTEENSA